MIAADLSWSIQGMDALDGPVDVGLAHSAYTVAQIVEAVDASPTSDSDLIAIEQGRRSVRTVGTFHSVGLSGKGQVLNDGKKMRTKLKFRVSNDEEISIWAINRGSPALTVDTTVQVAGKVYLTWQ